MFHQIVLAADGSTHSLKAADKAVFIAQTTEGAKVTVLHVVDDLPVKGDVADEYMRPRDVPDHRKKQVNLVEEKLQAENISFEVKHIFGDPGPAIVRESERLKADLLIIGSRGLNPVQQMVLGSVSHKVAKRATCPVMIVKDK